MTPLRAENSTDQTIGIFTAELDEGYQSVIWKGVEDRARELGIGLVTFLGSRIDSPILAESTANVAFRLIQPQNVDGLIVLSAAIATFVDSEKICHLFSAKGNLPSVSVGLTVEGVASLTVDGSEGITDLVRHLVEVHGRTRFGLIGGPLGHGEAEERKVAVRRALDLFGVGFDERLLIPGNFVQESGVEAVKVLIASKVPFDALFCMNDRTAIGAIGELRKFGIRVPEDVAVVGFDGIEEGAYVTPPLTTVKQPLFELGISAVDTLYDLLQGKKTGNKVLKCRSVVLESCGCLPRQRFTPNLADLPSDVDTSDRETIQFLATSASAGDRRQFLARLNRELSENAVNEKSLGRWHEYLSVVHSRVRREPGWCEQEQLFESARVLVGEAETRKQAAWRIDSAKRFATLRSLGATLVGAFEINTMIQSLAVGLRRLGIFNGYLVRFEGKDPVRGWSRLLMALGNNGELPPKGIRFKTKDLLPDGFFERSQSWVLEPLVFQREPLGYLLLPGGLPDSSVYDALREHVASALESLLLLEKIRTHERRLEVEVGRRTLELTRTNRELTQEIQRRSFLEQEVIKISNRTMERIGQDLHDDLCQHLAGIAMLTSVAKNGLKNSTRVTEDSLERIGNLLIDSIVRVKQIARGLMPTGLEAQGLAAAIETLVVSARRTYGSDIIFQTSPTFSLSDTDRALQLYRIVQEALLNALKHSGSPKIEVHLYRADPRDPNGPPTVEEPTLVAEVTDFGVGIPRNIPGEGMGLRIMRYRAEKADAVLKIEHLEPGTRVTCRIRDVQR